jgi:predicted TPR repeat methyltransferase
LQDLDPLFQSMEEGLQDGGFVAFTLENVGKETEDA